MEAITKIKNFIKTEKALTRFLVKLVLFLVLYSFIFRNHHILTNKLYGYSYQIINQPYLIYLIYPFLGLFFIIRRQKIREFGLYKTNLIQSMGFLFLSAMLFLTSMRDFFIEFSEFPPNFIYFSTMLPAFMALFTAIFGYKFVKNFSSDFFIIVYCFIVYLVGETMIGKFWVYLSGVILSALNFILPLFSKSVIIDPSQLSVMVNDFHVNIGAPCAGISSLVTFTFLFVVSVILLKQKNPINYVKSAIALVVGLGIIYLLNIIRVTTIILIGAFYSPEIAIDLFHEYMSAVMLIALFVAYLYFVFPRIIKQEA